MRRAAKGKRVEIDDDSRLRAMHDDGCDLRIFLGGRVADEALNGPRSERYKACEEKEIVESDQSRFINKWKIL